MAGPHDPDHAPGAGLALRAEAEATAHITATKEQRMVKESRTQTRFWLVMATLIPGLAALAIGFIFFSALPGTLAAETIGAGLALLVVCILLLTGVWGPARNAEPGGASASVVTSDRPAEPSAAAPASPDIAPEALPQAAPTAIEPEPSAEDAAPPDAERAPEPAASGADEREASVGLAASGDAPTASAAPPALEPAPAAEPAPTRDAPKRPTGQRGQNGHATPATTAPRTRARRASTDGAVPPLPALTNLPQRFPLPIGSKQLDTEAEDLSNLLGAVAEQTVTAVVTRGQPGLEHRARLAGKIDAFRQEMAVDPDYAPVAAFLESLVALLRAARPIPAAAALVDPFDGLYESVLTLIRSKTRKSNG